MILLISSLLVSGRYCFNTRLSDLICVQSFKKSPFKITPLKKKVKEMFQASITYIKQIHINYECQQFGNLHNSCSWYFCYSYIFVPVFLSFAKNAEAKEPPTLRRSLELYLVILNHCLKSEY